MTETRNDTCLAVKALSTADFVGTEDLDGDRAIQARVPRAVDLAHATRTEGGNDFERAQTRTGAEHDREVGYTRVGSTDGAVRCVRFRRTC